MIVSEKQVKSISLLVLCLAISTSEAFIFTGSIVHVFRMPPHKQTTCFSYFVVHIKSEQYQE